MGSFLENWFFSSRYCRTILVHSFSSFAYGLQGPIPALSQKPLYWEKSCIIEIHSSCSFPMSSHMNSLAATATSASVTNCPVLWTYTREWFFHDCGWEAFLPPLTGMTAFFSFKAFLVLPLKSLETSTKLVGGGLVVMGVMVLVVVLAGGNVWSSLSFVLGTYSFCKKQEERIKILDLKNRRLSDV